MKRQPQPLEITLSENGSWISGPYQANNLAQIERELNLDGWGFGTTKNLCEVSRNTPGRAHPHVATFRRSPDGDGTRWYRAEQ